MGPKRARPVDPAAATAAAKRPRRDLTAKNPPAQTAAAGAPPPPPKRPVKTGKAAPKKAGAGNEANTTAIPKRRGRPPKTTKDDGRTTTKGRGRPAAASQNKAQVPAKRRGRPPGSTKAKAQANKPVAVPGKAATAARSRTNSDPAAPSPPKKLKTEPVINEAPTQRLDVYVMGSGECSELGLGATVRNGQDPTSAEEPVLNDLLDAKTVGVVQVAAGGMHCAVLTHDSRILTWGVNDNGALGRDTTYTAPQRDADAGADSSDENDLNPRECTPTVVPEESFAGLPQVFVQVVATSSATFALTAGGRVIGWGQFSVSSLKSTLRELC